MTVAGVALILLGMVVAFTAEFAYNGQWLLGFLLAIAGVAIAATHTIKEKK